MSEVSLQRTLRSGNAEGRQRGGRSERADPHAASQRAISGRSKISNLIFAVSAILGISDLRCYKK